jgi:hypothetical protein
MLIMTMITFGIKSIDKTRSLIKHCQTMSAFISDKNDAIDYARIRLNHLFLTNFYKFDQRWSKPSCNRVTFDIYCLNDAFTSKLCSRRCINTCVFPASWSVENGWMYAFYMNSRSNENCPWINLFNKICMSEYLLKTNSPLVSLKCRRNSWSS